MFIDNRSSFRPRLNPTDLGDNVGGAAVSIRAAYAVTATGLQLAETLSEPDDTLGASALCLGTSWSLRGSVRAAKRGTTWQDLTIRVGGRAPTAIRICGERRWIRSGDSLVPTAPLAWESITLGARAAFGGSKRVPPGELNGLPHPGLTITEPRNPIGIGLQLNQDSAVGEVLPQVEFADDPLGAPCGRPEPSVLFLEKSNSLLKLPIPIASEASDENQLLLRSLHPAHRRAWGARLIAGDGVLIAGASEKHLAFELPASPVLVSMRQRRVWKKIGNHIRHVAIDLDRARVEILFGHAATYTKSIPVTDVRVENVVAA